MMTRLLDIRVLGPFLACWSDGEEATLSVRKAQCVIAYLAVEGRATRDTLAHLFWGERSEERARHNVRQVLSKIRSLCDTAIISDGDFVHLNPQSVSVDAARFLDLVRHDDEGSLCRSLELYSGELLEGLLPKEFEFQQWLLVARERLRNAACEAMDRYVGILITREDHDGAIAALNRRLAMDPACEPAHRKLMTTLDRMGRRSDALRQYTICADALRRELGAEPSADTLQTFVTIRDGSGDIEPVRDQPIGDQDAENPRVAVLPFENLVGDADEYFVDGITEDIITALSRFHSLDVIARGSTFIYKNKHATDSEIAEALDAPFLVRGSVRRSGNTVRINVQLLDGPAGVTLWGNRYELEMSDVFLVQDEITATVVSTLAGRVEATELERARKANKRRLKAYDYLLRGKDHHHRFTADDCATCIDMFNSAIETDPDYAVAHAWLACGLGQAMVWDLDDHARLVDMSQAAAERGLELDQNESECHRILAQVFLTRGDLSRSLHHQERALFLNPNDDRSVCSMGEILSFAGRHDEAEQWVRRSMKLNPYHPQRYWTHLARALLHRKRFGEALEVLDQIGRPRQDDLVYAIAASVNGGNRGATEKNVEALRIALPDFDTDAFLQSQPYECAADQQLIRGALGQAGF